MDFIKKHYEKILLCAVLLGLVGALVMMGFIIELDKQKSQDMKNNFFGGKVQPLPELDFTMQTNLVDRLQSPLDLDFSTTNKLFNPVQWQKDVNGKLIKITGDNVVGPGAAVVTKITPWRQTRSRRDILSASSARMQRFLSSAVRNVIMLPWEKKILCSLSPM